MNEQLSYLTDPKVLTFEAEIIEKVALKDGRIGVILDRSYFYPTSGGQEHDTGRIGEANVIEVFKRGDPPVVVHVVDSELPVGPIIAHIEPERRFRNSQHHTAQHLLTQCFVRVLNLETLSANINGFTPSTLDLESSSIAKTDLDEVEDLANTMIQRNLPVKSYFVRKSDIQQIPLRRSPPEMDEIRVVEIDGFDFSACGGTHCTRTGELGLVKILKVERQNNKQRVYFVTGQSALETLRDTYDEITSLAAEMSVHPHELAEVTRRQAQKLNSLEKEVQLLKQGAYVKEADDLFRKSERLANWQLSITLSEERPVAELRNILSELTKFKSLISVLANFDRGKTSVFIGCPKESGLSAQEILTQILLPFGGRGGGDDTIAQGGGNATYVQFKAIEVQARSAILNSTNFEA